MDLNGASNQQNTRHQPSIRSFFQPRTPQYATPPAPPSSQTPPLPPKQTFTSPPAVTSPTSTPTPAINPPKESQQQTSIVPVAEHHIQPLRRINALLLPISYPDSFYAKILSPSPPAPINLSRVILWHDLPTSTQKVIGSIIVRLDPALSPTSTPQTPSYIDGSYDVYIQSLALLSPYREKGLASQALEEVVKAAVEISNRREGEEGGEGGVRIRDLYAHVWTENEEALEWYAKRGFKKEGDVIGGYYRRLKPDGAWILRRRVGVEDFLKYTATDSGVGEVEAKDSDGGERDVRREENIRPGMEGGHTKSFQDRRPDREWNDLPEDVLRNGTGGAGGGGLKPPSLGSSAASSRSSSRSGLAAKKKRQYPAAAFGS